MFDATSFIRKRGRNPVSTFTADNWRGKLVGSCDDSVDSLAKLAEKQGDDVTVKTQKIQLNERITVQHANALTPADTAMLIRGKEVEKKAKVDSDTAPAVAVS